ncbi:hypothetical protein [Kaistella sp.]|uniref:hypothetical protein n=1 Tax=Kaistella sp. TaxID=2782235 RepID=UPI003C346920
MNHIGLLFLTLIIVFVVYYIVAKLEERFSTKEKEDYDLLMTEDFEHIHPENKMEF